MAKPVNSDVKQVAPEVLALRYEQGVNPAPNPRRLDSIRRYWRDLSLEAREKMVFDVEDYIEAILEGEFTMRRTSR